MIEHCWGQFSKYKPPPGGGGAYIWRSDLTEGFFALPVWGAYIWRGLYMERLIFWIVRYLCYFNWNLGIHLLKVIMEEKQRNIVAAKSFFLNTGLKVNVSVRIIKRNVNRVVCRVFSLSRLFKPLFLTDLVTVLEAILKSRQPREKLQCLYGNLVSNNFRKTAFRKKNMNCKVKLRSKGFY